MPKGSSPGPSSRRDRSVPERSRGASFQNFSVFNHNTISSSSNSSGPSMLIDSYSTRTVTHTRNVIASNLTGISTDSPHYDRFARRRSGQENITPRGHGVFPDVFKSGYIGSAPRVLASPLSDINDITPRRNSGLHAISRSSSRDVAGLNHNSPDVDQHTLTIQECDDDDQSEHGDDVSVHSYASGPRPNNRSLSRFGRFDNMSAHSRRKSHNKYQYMPRIRSGKVHRARPGTKALLEIRKLRKTTHNLIQKLPFQRVVREVVAEQCTGEYRFQAEALAALQESAEQFLVTMFEDSYKCSIHAGRKTLKPQDIQLVRMLQRW